jgi:hypothetical protein
VSEASKCRTQRSELRGHRRRYETRDILASVQFAQLVRKCLLSFGAESFVFQLATQKFKDARTEL